MAGHLLRHSKILRLGATTKYEGPLYALIGHFASLHKQTDPDRFYTYPQTNIPWNGFTNRSLISDFSLVNFTADEVPKIKLRVGIEAKKPTDSMWHLPPPSVIRTDKTYGTQLRHAFFQAQSQAKAVYKGDLAFSKKEGTWWVVSVGPYWTPVSFGPFTEPELTVRIGEHRRPDKDADPEAAKAAIAAHAGPNFPPPKELYLFGTPESYDRLEEIIASTDDLARSL